MTLREPLSYLHTAGPAADPATALTWGLLAISVAVTVAITALVVVGAWTRRSGAAPIAIRHVAVARRGEGVRWIWIGVGLSTVLLLAATIWTVMVLAATAHPPTAPALTLEITGNQWWWKARYLAADPTQVIVTANEIHIPVGRPVRVRLLSDDVIHSFWVPALAGKTDTIPGRTNVAWLQADRPGRYAGQCTEYCGQQHAHMAFRVFADPPAAFEAWRRHQLAPARPPLTTEAQRGAQIVAFRCGACHAIRGTEAGGTTGPDLTHLMSRTTLASGAIPNSPGGLAGWIGNPQGVKPGTKMPTLFLTGPELNDVRAYLLTLS
jgi:cytochrome c oxidase subunit 2